MLELRAIPMRPRATEVGATFELLRCLVRMQLRLMHNVEMTGGQ